MKLLIADLLSADARATLEGISTHLVYDHSLTDVTLVDAIREHRPNVIVVRSTKVTEEAVQAGIPDLSLVVRSGSGTDTIAKAFCAQNGVAVCNTPGCNSSAVAELTMGLLLSHSRRIPDAVADMRSGHWAKGHFGNAAGLDGSAVGVVGLGAIGMKVAIRCLAFGMTVHYYDPSKPEDYQSEFNLVRHDELYTMLGQVDYVSLHVPAVPGKTVGMINREFIHALKPGACIINASRGTIANEESLIQGLIDREDVFYCTDVFQNEPKDKVGKFVSPLMTHEIVSSRVYGVPHIGASTKQATAAVGETTVAVIRRFKETGEYLHQVC